MSPATGRTRRSGVPPADRNALNPQPTGTGSSWSGRPPTVLIPAALMAATAASYETPPRSHELAQAVSAPPVQKDERPVARRSALGSGGIGTRRL